MKLKKIAHSGEIHLLLKTKQKTHNTNSFVLGTLNSANEDYQPLDIIK